MITRPLLLLLLFCSASRLNGQVRGCKDPNAKNYNPNATVSDGSCVYDYSFYTPGLKVDPLTPSLSETSGLQWDGKNLWTFNDGGGAAAIYKIDTLTNTIWQTVNLEGATNVDWEDMAFDGTYFYIGDFGNNKGNRKDLKIYKFPIKAIQDQSKKPIVTIPASAIKVIQFSYADQPHPITSAGSQMTPFDCEAMIVDEGAIHLFSKDWINKTTTHYRINSTTAGTYSAQPIETFPVDFLVTGADKVKDQPMIALMGYNNTGMGAHYLYLLSDYTSGLFFKGNKRKVELPDVTVMGQAEGITFKSSTYGYISNEQFFRNVGAGTINVAPKLRSFDLTQLNLPHILPIQLREFSVREVQGTNQIAWLFEDSVSQLTVENSTDSSHFQDLFTIAKTASGIYIHKANQTENYYRLKWEDDKGRTSYSKIIKTTRSITSDITNVVLFATGKFAFTINSSTSLAYGFKITSIDGKLLSEIPIQVFTPGKHEEAFKHLPTGGAILLITGVNDNGQKTWLVSVHE